ncbi:hypothetical protein DPX16_20048 [Anabarilius grahami]|uniref:Uncharacterized protein n=1 Tax=Anabarilius grahami TaxID=495550 RepID=A0A3N0XSX4_ANAGA|nr:hypothetical protein DPX16_20048 [Anabarilius grahami]
MLSLGLIPPGLLSLELERCCFLLQKGVAPFAKPRLGNEVVGEASDDFCPFFDTDFVNAERDKSNTVIGIYIIRPEDAEVSDPPSDVGLIIEGVKVLQNLGDVTKACALLLGIIYSLNHSYIRPEEHF